MNVTLDRAAALIREGELVAFPTETVYGLGANALDPAAVAKIFALKGRPASSPLIVHVSSIEMARQIVTEWPPEAEALARRFWPGALSLVLPKASTIPDIVTAGLPTVGIRIPAHEIALQLIEAAGVPIAAPSANRFTGISPTTAEHVREIFGDDLSILDGGPCRVGIESTVVSIAAGKITLLRPGMISFSEIERVCALDHGEPLQSSCADARPGAQSWVDAQPAPASDAQPAPGMHPRHYSPRTPLIIVHAPEDLPNHLGAYLWRTRPGLTARCVRMPRKAVDYAQRLYGVLHEIDGEGWPWIGVEMPPDKPEWAAIRDRLRRASTDSDASGG
jgi:L-threonylcarbamoyladenylate synthase